MRFAEMSAGHSGSAGYRPGRRRGGKIRPGVTAAVCLLLAASVPLRAQAEQRDAPAAAKAGAVTRGICTDRLRPGHRRIWDAVTRIVQARDRQGRLLHPTLHGLWQWAQSSNHAIYVEMNDRKEPEYCSAGEFLIEDSGLEPEAWSAVVRLNLQVIQAATAKRRTDGTGGSISLERLDRNERCAAFFGHELAHAFLILEDPEYARLYREFRREAAAYHPARQRVAAKDCGEDSESRQRLQRLQSLMNRLEAPVGPFEEELWRELRPDSVAPTPGGAPVALPGMKVPGGRHRPLP